MSKHKGRDHHPVDKKLKKGRLVPPQQESLEAQPPQAPQPGTNAKNQYR